MHLLSTTLALAATFTPLAISQDTGDCSQVVTVSSAAPTEECTQVVSVPAATSSAAAGGTLSGANLVLMPLGDSITFGFGSSDGNGYRSALYDELVGAGATVDMVGSLQSGSMGDPDNEGHSGWTIDQIAGAAANVAGLDPNVVLVHVGTNDANGYPNPEQMGDRLTTMLDQIVGQWPDAGFLVAQIIPSSSSGTEANIETFNAQVPDIVDSFASAGTKMAVVDMHDAGITLGDSLHPNDQGYATMGGVWFDALEDAAAQGWFQ